MNVPPKILIVGYEVKDPEYICPDRYIYIDCPFCHGKERPEIVVDDLDDLGIDFCCDGVIDDYISGPPMLWCCARSVLLPNTRRDISYSEVCKLFPQSVQELEKIKEEEGTTILFYRVFDLAYIKRIATHQMYCYSSDVPLSDEKVQEIIHNKEIPDLKKRDSYENIEDTVFNISVPVNSYDAENPEIPYNGIDTRHDAINVYLLCQDEKNEDFIVNYWGD